MKKIGMLTPSSNTVLEPVTFAMVSGISDEVSVHFSRFQVTEISLKDNALAQFNKKNLLNAAKLLADAYVDVIAWNGTSAGWLGFDSDEELCRTIEKETGIPTTTSVLALNESFKMLHAVNYGLVTPYTEDVNEKIIANYETIGLNCIKHEASHLYVNHQFSAINEDEIMKMVGYVAEAKPDAITTFCTNLKAAPLVEQLENEYQIIILDTISVVVWKCLKMIGVKTEKIKGWGKLFQY
ncbi:arylsulfatase [Sporolactobacillus sp. Y61]|uniref:Arylsulfatase n=1 Tax=Sporolactobacillus sp. Y61 TaxID=3160863 RepID=A0AAU8IHR3_9BACL